LQSSRVVTYLIGVLFKVCVEVFSQVVGVKALQLVIVDQIDLD